jgi:hypothetical protein
LIIQKRCDDVLLDHLTLKFHLLKRSTFSFPLKAFCSPKLISLR